MAHHISLKRSWQRLQLYFKAHFNRRSLHKVIGFQSCKSPNLEVLRQNDIWVLAPWPSTYNTIRGKVVVSPKSRLWWVLWIYVCSWLICALKVFQLHTNQFVVWFMQVHVNNWLAFHSSLSLSRNSNTPLYPSSVVSQWAYPNSSFFHCVHFRLAFESIKELGSASNNVMLMKCLQSKL
jgi:hypothetical protein